MISIYEHKTIFTIKIIVLKLAVATIYSLFLSFICKRRKSTIQIPMCFDIIDEGGKKVCNVLTCLKDKENSTYWKLLLIVIFVD